jgi:hypothetical protein
MRRAFLALLAATAAAVAVDAFAFRLPQAPVPRSSRASPPGAEAGSRRPQDQHQQQRRLILTARRFAAPPPDGGYEGAAVQAQQEQEEEQIVSQSSSSTAALEEGEGNKRRDLGDLFQLWKRRLWYVACVWMQLTTTTPAMFERPTNRPTNRPTDRPTTN